MFVLTFLLTNFISTLYAIVNTVRSQQNMCIICGSYMQRHFKCIAIRWWWYGIVPHLMELNEFIGRAVQMLALWLQLASCIHFITTAIVEESHRRLLQRWKSEIFDIQWVDILELDNWLQSMLDVNTYEAGYYWAENKKILKGWNHYLRGKKNRGYGPFVISISIFSGQFRLNISSV